MTSSHHPRDRSFDHWPVLPEDVIEAARAGLAVGGDEQIVMLGTCTWPTTRPKPRCCSTGPSPAAPPMSLPRSVRSATPGAVAQRDLRPPRDWSLERADRRPEPAKSSAAGEGSRTSSTTGSKSSSAPANQHGPTDPPRPSSEPAVPTPTRRAGELRRLSRGPAPPARCSPGRRGPRHHRRGALRWRASCPGRSARPHPCRSARAGRRRWPA